MHLQFEPMIRLGVRDPYCTGNEGPCGSSSMTKTRNLRSGAWRKNSARRPARRDRSQSFLWTSEDFSHFVQKLLPYDVIHALNRCYFHLHGGVVDNAVGNGSLFRLEETGRIVSRAFQYHLEMLQAVEDMRSYFEAIHGRSFDLRGSDFITAR